VKGGYKEFDELMSAKAEPVIAEPEIHGGIELDESCRYSFCNYRQDVSKTALQMLLCGEFTKTFTLRGVQTIHRLTPYGCR
jgi:hypothetical protein